jgi:hypothetical protein
MYSWLWRKLPGKRWLKVIQSLILIGLLLILLYLQVFPWLNTVLYPEPQTGL